MINKIYEMLLLNHEMFYKIISVMFGIAGLVFATLFFVDAGYGKLNKNSQFWGITIPNKTITSSVLTNYTRNPLRRIVVNIGVDYSTDIDKAKKVLVDIANSEDRILENPKPVCYVTAFEASDINLSLRCYVPNVLYWDVFFALNEKILIEFNKQNIQIPYNRLVVQTLDEDGKVNVKKGVKTE